MATEPGDTPRLHNPVTDTGQLSETHLARALGDQQAPGMVLESRTGHGADPAGSLMGGTLAAATLPRNPRSPGPRLLVCHVTRRWHRVPAA